MTPLWALLPGIQASGSRYLARNRRAASRPVLGIKGSLRRGKLRRALTPPRRSAEREFATGGSAGNQKRISFFVSLRREQMEVDKHHRSRTC